MLTYRRKPDSGKLFTMSRKGGHKARKASMVTYYPGDEIQVESKEQLPGYPNAWHGWELVGVVEKVPVPQPKKDMAGVGECLPQAELEAIRSHGNRWRVVVKTPGLNITAKDGVVLPVGTKVHQGLLTESQATAMVERGCP